MAKGDVHIFAAFEQKTKSGAAINLAADSLKLGIVKATTVPAVTTPDPRWGAGGTTDFSAAQVNLGTAYAAPIALAGVTFTNTAGVLTLAAQNVLINYDAAGFTDAAYGIIYDDTAAGKPAVGFVDLGGPQSIQAVPLFIKWNTAGIATWAAS
jgi:hypothetical protein